LLFSKELTGSPSAESAATAMQLITSIILLKQRQSYIPQASLIGEILSNMHLMLAFGFLVRKLRYREQIYNSAITQ